MHEPMTSVEILQSLTGEDAAALRSLLAQLSTTAMFDEARIRAILQHEGVELIVARYDGQIVGMATLVVVPLPSGIRGHVEDVVVDASMRGRGIARRLLETVTSMAVERGLRTLDLTSRPARESALRLYEAAGFVRRDTAVLRFEP
ncbi:UNVERIFIED_CONTAM: GNAT family N-acetyltransferase [Microbacterium sp. SLM126]